MTLVVNLFAGPGTGKSTTAALTFGKLKQLGVNSEIVHEFAKDLTWEKRTSALAYQPYIFGKQSWHIHRLIDQVDVIVTDSPILFCGFIYGKDQPDVFRDLVLHTFNSWNTLNIFLLREPEVHKYNPAGRGQTESEAMELDREISSVLTENHIKTEAVSISRADVVIPNLIMSRLWADVK